MHSTEISSKNTGLAIASFVSSLVAAGLSCLGVGISVASAMSNSEAGYSLAGALLMIAALLGTFSTIGGIVSVCNPGKKALAITGIALGSLCVLFLVFCLILGAAA